MMWPLMSLPPTDSRIRLAKLDKKWILFLHYVSFAHANEIVDSDRCTAGNGGDGDVDTMFWVL